MILALVLTSLCGIYISVAREWQRQQGQADALVATSTACSRLADYISQATGVSVQTRYTSGDTLALNMPADTRNNDIYIPTWSDGIVQYRSGNWIIFYLSDTSGSYSKSGNILWCASMNWTFFPWSVSPDASWSLYYNMNKGRIAPIDSLQFTLTTDAHPRVTISAVSTYSVLSTTARIQQKRTVCLRNAN